ncbi:hypothetical protein FGG08_002765 [Glutinoglossum americanum]|uniref:Transporter n=1 Tax=Glutinoglossum americanum TaxID=1670608 RepID=A0A9P8KYW1_9PEZI|nr:hypothetical protein FGG08_002765 [Glutinoglossum americanum]
MVMLFWGILTGAHVWVRKRWQLITIRILIGMLEAGFYPTTVSYLSLFYTRFEFAKRLGLFYGQYAISGALGGVLSYVVFKAFPPDEPPSLGGTRRAPFGSATAANKWKSWQVLFLVEGSTTIVVALVGFFWLPHGPGSAWFLRPNEREWAERRVLNDRTALDHFEALEEQDGYVVDGPAQARAGEERTEGWIGRSRDEDAEQAQRLISEEDSRFEPSNSRWRVKKPQGCSTSGPPESIRGFATDKGLSRRDVVEAITDWKIWYILVVNICSSIPGIAFSVFLPLVVKGLGFGSATANLLTVPPFLSGAVALWIFTWWSDKRRERIIPVLWGLFINLAGLTAVVMLPTNAYLLRYLALCVLLAGTFVASPLTVAWLSGNMEVLFAFFGYALLRRLLVRENATRRRILEKWNAEEVERELRYGQGPPVDGRRTVSALFGGSTAARSRVWSLPLLSNLSDWWYAADELGDVRRGDEKITFCYGL